MINDKLELWWQANKANLAKEVQVILENNKYRLLAESKTTDDFITAMLARKVPEHVARIALDLF